MSYYSINTDQITSWESFHNLFSHKFSFPSYYGNNMDAWIDCMSDFAEQEEIVCLNFENIDNLKKRNIEIYEAIVECSLFINRWFSEQGEKHLIAISFFERGENNQNSIEIQKLVASAKERGFLYKHEVLEALPIDICDTDQVNDIVEFIRNRASLLKDETIEHNKKFQLTAGSATRFQRSFLIKVHCAGIAHHTSASGH